MNGTLIIGHLRTVEDWKREGVIPVRMALTTATIGYNKETVNISYNASSLFVEFKDGTSVEYPFEELIRDANENRIRNEERENSENCGNCGHYKQNHKDGTGSCKICEEAHVPYADKPQGLPCLKFVKMPDDN